VWVLSVHPRKQAAQNSISGYELHLGRTTPGYAPELPDLVRLKTSRLRLQVFAGQGSAQWGSFSDMR